MSMKNLPLLKQYHYGHMWMRAVYTAAQKVLYIVGRLFKCLEAYERKVLRIESVRDHEGGPAGPRQN